MSVSIRPMTEQDLKDMISEHKRLNPDLPVREDIKESLDLYTERGILPGDFLTAVLENDLFGALGRADSYNRATIFQITSYIYNNLPSNCWGSKERVANFLKEFN